MSYKLSAERKAQSVKSKIPEYAVRYALCATLLFTLTACQDDMRHQARYDPLEASSLFENGQASRPIVEGTVPRGHLEVNEGLYQGKRGGQYVTTIPLKMDKALLERGRERYNIYCSVCHDSIGTGEGMVVRRGFTKPPSLHDQRLRDAPVGYLFEIMTRGLGNMSSYANEIKAHDRWAIVSYIKALQLSQNASVTDAPKEKQKQLRESVTHE